MGDRVWHVDLRAKQFDCIRDLAAGGKGILQFATSKDAKAKADEVGQLLAEYGEVRLAAWRTVLKDDPHLLLAKLKPFGKTLRDAVDHYVAFLEAEAKARETPTVAAAIREWVEDNRRRVRDGVRRERTVQTIAGMARKFETAFGERRIASISSEDVQRWIDALAYKDRYGGLTGAEPRTKYHHRRYLSQFFRWCVRKGKGVRVNPCDGVDVPVRRGEPTVLTVEECERLFELVVTPSFVTLLPYYAICTFAGVRPTECQRLDWSSVEFDEGQIAVKASHAKTNTGRRIPIQPNLMEWLKWFKRTQPDDPLIPQVNFNDRNRQFRRELGFWIPNGMRHSFASYYLGGIKQDYQSLEAWMGNSRIVLQSYYVNFPTKADSKRFWNILPPVP